MFNVNGLKRERVAPLMLFACVQNFLNERLAELLKRQTNMSLAKYPALQLHMIHLKSKLAKFIESASVSFTILMIFQTLLQFHFSYSLFIFTYEFAVDL